jgi:hypothetical protein
MSSTSGAARQHLSEIAAHIDANRAQAASDAITALFRNQPVESLELLAPELREQIGRLLPRRKRDLSALLEAALSRTSRPPIQVVKAGEIVARSQPARPALSSVERYRARLTDLGRFHIFQWATYYRETVLYLFKDLQDELRGSDEWAPTLDAVSKVFSEHALDIFGRGFQHLGGKGVSSEVAEIKSINGLQKFLYLVVTLLLEQRDGIKNSRDARLSWDIASSLIVGILRGYGRLAIDEVTGWSLLRRNLRAWLPPLGFTRGSDAQLLLQEFPGSERPDDIFVTVISALLGVEKFGNRFHGSDFMLPRLSRVAIGEPPRLDLTYTTSETGSTRELIVSCFFQGTVSETRVLAEAVSLRASAVVVKSRGLAKTWIDGQQVSPVLDASEVLPSAEQTENFSEMVRASLEASARAQSDLIDADSLGRNFAREFPLEDPDFRKLFLVERHSVKRLLEQFEEGSGIHLWCSVRRSGKTTAVSSLSDMTARSVVVLQTMDHQPNQPELNVFLKRVREAFAARQAIAEDFFAKVVRECALSNVPIEYEQRKVVLIIDEYETLFGMILAYTSDDVGLRYLVAQPLLSQMVGFAANNLLVFMGQRPDAHLILSSQNQLSPLVRQHNFPLFEHFAGATDTEFTQFLRRVLTEKLPFAPSFADAVFHETSGHPYLTVNLLVDLCDWLILNRRREGHGELDSAVFSAFAKDRLSQAALERSPYYSFFHGMLSEYLSELGRRDEPWLYAVSSVLIQIARKHPRSFGSSLPGFQQIAAPFGPVARATPERLLASAVMSNFLKEHDGQVFPGIRLMARLAASAVPHIN